jgi:serine/threonine-protein kinase
MPEEARAFLQDRLRLFYQVVFLVNVAYYLLFAVAVGLDPGIGLWGTLRQAFSLEALGEYLVFGGCWLLTRRGRWGQRTLEAVDVVGLVLGGCCFAAWPFLHPYPVLGTYELVLAWMALFNLRAVLVPSTGRRSLVVTLCAAVPGLVTAPLAAHTREQSLVAPATLVFLVAAWCAVAVTFSAVASALLWGLRKQVRDARRLGQYTLLERLGSGAMGVVYLARHAMLRRPTAIKLLSAGADGPALARFEREVQCASELTHPNTLAIYDYGRTADGVFYYAMEYLDGVDLEGLLAVDGPQPPARVIHVLRQVCGALDEAHGRDLLHRDLKPANVFLCRRHGAPDLVKVLDYGLVKDLAARGGPDASGAETLTGTPHYLSPESVSAPAEVDARGDLYSLGALAYALLTGAPPFTGRTVVEVCAHHLHTVPVPPSARAGQPVPADLEAVVLRCLEKRPEARFASARELRAALEACQDAGGWTEAHAEAWWERRGAAVQAHRKARGSASSLSDTQTLLMDLRGRAA